MAKSATAFRTISEAAEEVGAPQHVLRFWEGKFDFVSPVKRAGGRRFYRPQDIAVLKAVRRLLHDDGLTIRGVQRLYEEQGLKKLVGVDVADLIVPGDTAETAAETTNAGADTAGNTPEPQRARGLDLDRLARVVAELEAAQRRLNDVLSA